MISARVLLIAVVLVVSPQLGLAQDVSRYRAYVLESSLESVIAASGARAADVRTLHKRPATIQELEWRAPYATAKNELADPVRAAVFTFCDNVLYQIVVNYDRDRTEGLTSSQIIESLTVVYGAPALKSARNRSQTPLSDTIVIAQWESTSASLTLVRGAYSDEFQLVLMSKALSAKARSAIQEAARLDAIDAPRRELEQRKKDVADETAARDKIRNTNEAAFRP